MTGRQLAGEGIRYIIVGVYNTLFTLAVFWVLDHLFGATVGVQVVFWTAAVLGIANGFVSQRLFVWRSKNAWRREIGKFFALNLSIAVINSLALFVTVTLIGLPSFPSQLGITAVLVVVSFFLNRAWVFTHRAGPPVPPAI